MIPGTRWKTANEFMAWCLGDTNVSGCDYTTITANRCITIIKITESYILKL